ncbi:hypothetical protein ACFWPU_06860 [Streptomyces sp. NPDC058471]
MADERGELVEARLAADTARRRPAVVDPVEVGNVQFHAALVRAIAD